MRVRPAYSPESEREQAGNLPPGQFVTDKFPVFTYGRAPEIDIAEWRLRIFGLGNDVTLAWEDFAALPQTAVRADLHCVTRWSRLDNLWEGVAFRDVMRLAQPPPDARFVTIHCYGGYTTNLALEALLDPDVLLAHSHDGLPLAPEHGWPLRLVVPGRYGWKSAKWVNGIEFMAQDRPGFWEVRGYSSSANPWLEERTWASGS
ncbi:MAG: sulfite oxidase-like oxidoreductase [Chloroflexota bacterium]|nr:sulfite oxidase-like oxidoreductase [Chloroflexota bacterium]MDE2942352.1 sulfite oxidase-like oxidoreductase [Chloroflexota bacterium]MDE3268243.1 sulfite oxidase-like oxidoreductase [Chloroflexota bacterium]